MWNMVIGLLDALGAGLENLAVWLFAIAAILAAFVGPGALAAYLCALMCATYAAEQAITWWETRERETEGETA